MMHGDSKWGQKLKYALAGSSGMIPNLAEGMSSVGDEKWRTVKKSLISLDKFVTISYRSP